MCEIEVDTSIWGEYRIFCHTHAICAINPSLEQEVKFREQHPEDEDEEVLDLNDNL
jgi:hypothetical protein